MDIQTTKLDVKQEDNRNNKPKIGTKTYLSILCKQLEDLIDKHLILGLIRNLRFDDVDKILKQLDYSLTYRFLKYAKVHKKYLNISDIPDRYKVILLIYIYGSGHEVEEFFGEQKYQFFITLLILDGIAPVIGRNMMYIKSLSKCTSFAEIYVI